MNATEPRFQLFRADVWSGDYILAGERLEGTADVPEEVDDWLDTAYIGMEPGDAKKYEDTNGNIWSLTCE